MPPEVEAPLAGSSKPEPVLRCVTVGRVGQGLMRTRSGVTLYRWGVKVYELLARKRAKDGTLSWRLKETLVPRWGRGPSDKLLAEAKAHADVQGLPYFEPGLIGHGRVPKLTNLQLLALAGKGVGG